MDGDQNVLCTLTSEKALDRRILGSISNGTAEDYKGHSNPCLSGNQKVSSLCITLSGLWPKNFWFPGKQDKSRPEGTQEA